MPLKKVTGYLLRQHRQALELDLKALLDEIAASLYVFKTDQKRSPKVISEEIIAKENAICKVEMLQARYNLEVQVKVGEEQLSLCEAVKRVGGASRLEKLWRSMVALKKDRYSSGPETERASDKEYAARSVTVDDAKTEASKRAWYSSALRAAVAMGNSIEVELDVPEGILQ